MPDYNIVLLARNKNKAEKAVKKLQDSSRNQNISYLIADLSRKHEIEILANQWTGPLHVLINNAAATPKRREETPEGIEMQWATNVLGYFWMMEYFLPHLEKSPNSRIVNVASYWAGGLDLNDPEFKHRKYDNDSAYRQSKQADRMLTVAFSDKFKEKGISVNACHPGDVRSTLAGNLGFGGHETPEQGAATPVWLATSPELEGITGKYFEHLNEVDCRYGHMEKEVDKLFFLLKNY